MKKFYSFIILGILLSGSLISKEKLFTKLTPRESGIEFRNEVQTDPLTNYFASDYIYNGGGVAVGDLNNDGLQDLVLSGNNVDSRIYFNDGDLEFEDVTEEMGFSNLDQFVNGVILVDINADGWLDIYLSTGYHGHGDIIRNKLWINNKGENFTEESKKYGVDVSALGIHSSFFDYDKDGDLDLYCLTRAPHGIDQEITKMYAPDFYGYDRERLKTDSAYFKKYYEEFSREDSFYENVDGVFIERKDIGLDADKSFFGLGIVTCDINGDGWTDIYCTNDYQSNDLLYFNNGDGTFRFATKEATKQISNNAMGLDINDFNNDNLPDIMVVDMTAADNKRLKANMSGMEPSTFYENLEYGNHYEYMFNTLQLNNGNETFSQIAFLAGVGTTDWSWAPLFADFDNDFDKDLFVSNGVRYDMRWSDVLGDVQTLKTSYTKLLKKFNPDMLGTVETIEEKFKLITDDYLKNYNIMGYDHKKSMGFIPSTPIPNYVYENDGDLTLNDVSSDWGLNDIGFSSGAAYADLDNDGDLDLVLNNVDDYSFVYENNADDLIENNYIRFKLNGKKHNRSGLNTKAILYANGKTQYQELTRSRGFISSVESIIHFGVGKLESIDSVQIIWLDNSMQTLVNPELNETHIVDIKDANKTWTPPKAQKQLFTKRPTNEKLNSKENRFYDYDREILLPHQMSKFGPSLAVADLNGDGYTEFYTSGAKGKEGEITYYYKGGKLIQKKNNPFAKDSTHEDMGALFFDADGDGDDDLYVVSGSNEEESGSEYYQDRFYVNNKGKFKLDNSKIPTMTNSGSVVTGSDFDKDGDIDLFIGGRQVPGMYPHPATSTILRNDGGNFTDVTKEVAPDLIDLGMVTSALWTDYDSDGDRDLMIVGEWMPVTILRNDDGKFTNASILAFDKKTEGWWWSLQSGDFDGDGDIDYVAGNLGLNYKYKASQDVPFVVYSDDFDNNGSNDIVLSYFEKGVCYPLRGRSCSSQQVPEIKKKFPSYDLFSEATLTDVYGEESIDNSLELKAYHFASSYFENNGDGTFKVKELPQLAQISTMFGIAPFDYNHDGNLDILTSGNFYEAEIETPRADASIGLLLVGDGKGNFEPVSNLESGFVARNNARGLALINTKGDDISAFVMNNDSEIEIFDFDGSNILQVINPNNDVEKVEHIFDDGSMQMQELYFGAGYLTQGSRMIAVTKKHSKIILHKIDGTKETMEFSVN